MVITLPPTYVGLYSERAAQYYGTVIYKSLDGSRQHVTCVCPLDKVNTYKWPDAIRVGWVTEYIRQGKQPEWQSTNPLSLWRFCQ
jgi:hypothetical protein